MFRSLRRLLVGTIAIGFLYLLVHAHEPLRLNVGDPWSDANVLTAMSYVKSDGFLATSFADVLDVGPLTADSYRYIHYPPGAEIFYSAVGKYLGVTDIGTLRLFAIAWSGLAMWLLFGYARRMYSERVAWIATALFATSPLWMMYADSIHQAPLMWAMAFLALWGLVRAIETGHRRFYAAACLGCFGCFFTSYDCYIFLPAAVLATVYVKHGKRRLVALCAAGCLLGIAVKCLTVIGAVGWNEFVADLRLQFVERATTTYDGRVEPTILPTLVRRLTLVLTPLVWLTVSVHVLKAIRAPSLRAALVGTAAWMLVVALAFVAVFSELATSQLLASQVFLPFYAFGSALVLDQMLGGRAALRRFAVVWLVAAPAWTFAILLAHPRSVLARDDVAKTNAYLAVNDHNDFVMTNLESAGHIQASFERHAWSSPDRADKPEDAARGMMGVFEITGTDSLHELIFSDPDSRFIDKSLWGFALPRRLWSVTGWPHLVRAKANAVIADYDRRVLANLQAVGAKNVLQLGNYAVYRVDRATVAAVLGDAVSATSHLDFGNLATQRHLLFGWSAPHVIVPEHEAVAVASITGFERCSFAHCKTLMTEYGLAMKDVTTVHAAQIMVRIDRACDLQLTFRFATPSYVRFSINRFVQTMPPGPTATFTVPAKNLVHGVDVIELENLLPPSSVDVVSLDMASACAE